MCTRLPLSQTLCQDRPTVGLRTQKDVTIDVGGDHAEDMVAYPINAHSVNATRVAESAIINLQGLC